MARGIRAFPEIIAGLIRREWSREQRISIRACPSPSQGFLNPIYPVPRIRDISQRIPAALPFANLPRKPSTTMARVSVCLLLFRGTTRERTQSASFSRQANGDTEEVEKCRLLQG